MKNRFEEILNNIRNLTDDEFNLLIEDAIEETLTVKNNKRPVIKAGELKVGSQIAEADGFIFKVIEISKETSKTITVKLASDFSSIKTHWTCNGGILKTFRKSTLLYGTL